MPYVIVIAVIALIVFMQWVNNHYRRQYTTALRDLLETKEALESEQRKFNMVFMSRQESIISESKARKDGEFVRYKLALLETAGSELCIASLKFVDKEIEYPALVESIRKFYRARDTQNKN